MINDLGLINETSDIELLYYFDNFADDDIIVVKALKTILDNH